MIVLYPNEQILFQKEAKITIKVKLKPGKIEGKGIFYITNMRIVFETDRMGILTQFTLNEMHGYRKVKGLLSEKMTIDYQRSHSSDVMLAEIEFKGIDEAYRLLNTLTNSNTTNVTIIDYKNSNYNMMNTTSTKGNNIGKMDDLDGAPDYVKPWIEDIKFTWNTITRPKELGLISDDDEKPWEYFDYYVMVIDRDFKNYATLVNTTKFADDFKYKVAREAYRMRANFPYENNYTYDSNRYWIGIIKGAYKDGSDELVGININADSMSSFFIYSPEFWYRRFLTVVSDDYDYEEDKPFIPITEDTDERFKTKLLLLADAAKKYYFAVLNKDFKIAESAWQNISEIYKKYDTDTRWLSRTGKYGLLLRYAIEMDKRNIPIPIDIKRSPV